MIRFEALLSVKADSMTKSTPPGETAGALTITANIATHSEASNFVGEVPIHVESLDISNGSDFDRFWSDKACHKDRGYPHLDLRHIEGTSGSGATLQAIDARPVIVGKPVPIDQIRLDTRASALDSAAKVTALETMKVLLFRTSQSHLIIEVRLSRLRC
jgi:hypothetical protein